MPDPTDGRSTLPAIIEQPSPVLDPDAVRVPTTLQLPPHRDKAGRVADHVAALSADMRAWTELQIALLWRKVEGVVGIFERIQHLVPALKLYVPGALLVVVGLFFLLVTAALGVGALVGSYWLGFLIVTLVLFAVGGGLIWAGRRRQRDAEAVQAKLKEEQKQEQTPTRGHIAEAEGLAARQASL